MSASLYETHATVRCDGDRESDRLRRWAVAAGLKLTHIVLARGRMREQPRRAGVRGAAGAGVTPTFEGR
ncbi:hypothetical protein [Streptomyces dysideae]|uniref:hypothetical protein n=1 Tax=Streptomyces dysideae TaxID=909626 RepID=UPI00131ECA32